MEEISTVIGGGTPKTNNPAYYEGGTIPWITPADLSGYQSKYIGHGERFITEAGLKNSSARMMPEGTVLFTSRAPIGYVAIASNPVCTNQGFKSFVLKEDILPDYVYWYLKGNKDIAESLASGTTFLELSGAKAKQIPFPLAPLPVQKLIVAEIEKQFSRLDEAVAGLKRVQANLKRYKAAVLKAAVEGRLTEEWRKQNICKDGSRTAPTGYESGADLLKRILVERRAKWEGEQIAKMRKNAKNVGAIHELPLRDDTWKKKYKEPAAPDISNLPELPEGWVWATVEQLSNIVTKGSSPNWQGFDYVSQGINFIRSQNVGWGYLDLSDVAYLPKEFNEKEKKSILKRGDVLLNIVGASIGRAAIANKDVAGGNVNQAVAVIRLVSGGLNNIYLKNYLISPGAQDRLHSEKVDVARANISLSDIANFPVPLPPYDEQKEIIQEVDRRLSVAEEIEAVIETNLKRAERMRQAILKKAFEGRLVAQKPSRLKL